MRWFAAALLLLCPTMIVASDTAQIDALLNTGRHVVGIVDGQTDSQHLWVRSVRPGVLLQSGYPWSSVTSVSHGTSTYSGQQMVEMMINLRSVLDPSMHIAEQPVRHSLTNLPVEAIDRVCTVDVDAVPANWDRDADFDGLRIVIAPRNSGLKVIPTDAIVEIELVGEQSSPTHPARRQFVKMGKWTRSVRANQFGPAGVKIEVPYQRRSNGRRLDSSSVLNDGIVHIRFKVAGLGSFEGSDPWVRMRPNSRFVDRYRLHTGRESTRYGRPPATLPQFRPLQSY